LKVRSREQFDLQMVTGGDDPWFSDWNGVIESHTGGRGPPSKIEGRGFRFLYGESQIRER